MKTRLFTFMLLLLCTIGTAGGSPSKPWEFTLTEFKNMPGVEVFIEDQPNTGSKSVHIELLDSADFRGLGLFGTLFSQNTHVSLIIKDVEKHLLVDVPLSIRHIGDGGSFSGKSKKNYRQINFEIAPNLLSNSYLVIAVEKPLGGPLDTTILLGDETAQK